MKIVLRLVLVSLLFVTLGCKQQFDKNKWSAKKDWDYPHRNSMLKDLLKNHELKGKPLSEVTDMLGEPDNREGRQIYYDIVMKYGSDIDPIYSKELEITFNTDSVVTAVKVQEHKN
ncbi:hypothetical protein LJ707_19655 [Mucilaginibacter sp. UR6-1]|uniref:hypothetical protein n=1 Tax=Mucilaginibacter sp. UR6-1 TaxID=1435643 RepID=UPI001E4472BD|nr:hypothetical protein [Mucilaginibacter sp. UR6-1]MCC8411167.1 hypothetical protein [Mucilaginibacter sp. UR6-1]